MNNSNQLKEGFIRILSIDGGGIRGILPCMVLEQLEIAIAKKLGEKQDEICLRNFFELVAGTSTGGLIAAGLTIPHEKKNKFCNSRELSDVYLEHSHKIFPNSGTALKAGDALPRTLLGYAEASYPAVGLVEVLDELFANQVFSAAQTAEEGKPGKVLIASYDLTAREPTYFLSWTPEFGSLQIKDIGRATSAAPTYFPSKGVIGKFPDDTNSFHTHAFVDGGLFANNPALAAVTKAAGEWPDKKWMVLSIGCGGGGRNLVQEEIKYWGQTEWVEPMISTMFDASGEAVHRYLREFSKISNGKLCYYKRINFNLPPSLRPMDNSRNVPELKKQAEVVLASEDFQTLIAEIADVLTQRDIQRLPVKRDFVEIRHELKSDENQSEDKVQYFWEATSRPRRALLFHVALSLPIAVLLFNILPVKLSLKPLAFDDFLEHFSSFETYAGAMTITLLLSVIAIGGNDIWKYLKVTQEDDYNVHGKLKDMGLTQFFGPDNRSYLFFIVGGLALVLDAVVTALVFNWDDAHFLASVTLSAFWILVFFILTIVYIEFPLWSVLWYKKRRFDYIEIERDTLERHANFDVIKLFWTCAALLAFPLIITIVSGFCTQWEDYRFNVYEALVLTVSITTSRAIVHVLTILEAQKVGQSSDDDRFELKID